MPISFLPNPGCGPKKKGSNRYLQILAVLAIRKAFRTVEKLLYFYIVIESIMNNRMRLVQTAKKLLQYIE